LPQPEHAQRLEQVSPSHIAACRNGRRLRSFMNPRLFPVDRFFDVRVECERR
jgi:hypothetical protein